MENEESVFQFDLRESIYFEDHQQVSEIAGISLEPEISIQTFGDYVSIRGVIALNGEYQPVDNSIVEQEHPTFEKHARRYMETVNELENGLAEFSHRFPVEISVPLNRIQNMDEVTVKIDTFDYELPDPSQLIIDADVTIHGIARSEETKETPGASQVFDEEFESFDFEFKQEKKESSEDEVFESFDDVFEPVEMQTTETSELPESRESSSELSSISKEVEGNSEIQPEVANNVEEESSQSGLSESEEGRWKWGKTSQSFEEFFAKKQEIESTSSNESSETDPVEVESSFYESYDDIAVESSTVESSSPYGNRIPENKIGEKEQEAEQEKEQEEEETDRKSGSTDVSYLSDLFHSREEKEEFASMKLCIVQDKDTLESIAERYQTTSMHIIKRNSLDSENISAGQLLYIPVRKKK
ncbi:LysM peptidoglycan-binding domain-containing protein [Virgibacillus sp. 179-BFC.A HS]|uniref:LysM peptidoglycan-binding domain-containing protein n=1 Tax=Tigheibacillus jepli TaxID=3035914 RepID=A0ABU5CGJ2_9BACI|nr:LysM peptidoglycan-binding domain-containing protein [Virgibacillus sp. 179-BFC.A HS]MDY0405438.1 LysM peptidoglycan-binding domain-containing protein [Virgibacillus sp. 179-BFC.A HS]